ncbi:MAG: hypothetical protein AAFP20_25150, partial [Cyanobacteria bacterium J06614_10]
MEVMDADPPLDPIQELMQQEVTDLLKRAEEFSIESLIPTKINCRQCNRKVMSDLDHLDCPSHVDCILEKAEYKPSRCSYCQTVLGFVILRARVGDLASVKTFRKAFMVFRKKLKRFRGKGCSWVQPAFMKTILTADLIEVAKINLQDLVDPDYITVEVPDDTNSQISDDSISSKVSSSIASSAGTSASTKALLLQMNTNLAMMGNQLEKVTKRLDESEAEKKAFHAEMNKFKEDMQEGIAKTLPSLSGDSHTSSFKGFQTVSQLGNNPPSLSGESQVSSFEGFKKPVAPKPDKKRARSLSPASSKSSKHSNFSAVVKEKKQVMENKPVPKTTPEGKRSKESKESTTEPAIIINIKDDIDPKDKLPDEIAKLDGNSAIHPSKPDLDNNVENSIPKKNKVN